MSKYSKICNSIGAIEGYIYKKINCMIKLVNTTSRYCLQTKGIIVYMNSKRFCFNSYKKAIEFTEHKAIQEIKNYMFNLNIKEKDIIINKQMNTINSVDSNIPLITRYIFEGKSKK